MKNVIGIDPGLSGGIAAIINGVPYAWPMPVAGKELDLAAIRDLIRSSGPGLAVVEKVGSMPGQGLSSTFKFGMGYGAIQGILTAMDIPIELVTPQRWKGRVLAGTKKDKDAAVAYCRRAFPTVPLVLPRCRKAHDGMADALCLAEMGRREFLGQEFAEQVKAKRAS
jgi:hypothetical protein